MYHVILADDEPLILAGLKCKIDWQAYGFDIVQECMDGRSLLNAVSEKKPDLLIMDIQMPQATGIDVMRELRTQHPVHVIVISGYSDFSYAHEALRYGVLDYLLQMKEQGVVRHIGLSTHAPELANLDATPEERDYSIIGSFTPDDAVGKCVYCRHCHPCPAGLDIGLINKYYDLSLQGDILAKEHYLTLEKTASDCIACGHCNKRCPFKVQQQKRMETIREYFGK